MSNENGPQDSASKVKALLNEAMSDMEGSSVRVGYLRYQENLLEAVIIGLEDGTVSDDTLRDITDALRHTNDAENAMLEGGKNSAETRTISSLYGYFGNRTQAATMPGYKDMALQLANTLLEQTKKEIGQ